jgi:hypothetical protein
MPDIQPTANVPVKSAWLSKINWAQAIAATLTFITAILGALHLDATQTAEATAAVAVIGQVATVIIKTFFTASVTPSSAAKI